MGSRRQEEGVGSRARQRMEEKRARQADCFRGWPVSYPVSYFPPLHWQIAHVYPEAQVRRRNAAFRYTVGYDTGITYMVS